MISREVYEAARRSYLASSPYTVWEDDTKTLIWAQERWPQENFEDMLPWYVAFWVLSISMQDGHK